MEELPQLAQAFISLRMGQNYRNYTRGFAQNELNTIEILELVNKQGQAHPNEMSEKLAIATSQMAVVLNHLEKEGLIERIRDESDHRKTIIKATLKGKEYNRIQLAKYHHFIAEVFETMGEEEAKEFVALFSKFIAASFQVMKERGENAKEIRTGGTT